ncbi:hypothetical protein CHH28_16470 [Bacterioplanes sanyensis]|uniref:IPT/TIG domain-containing protein n=1 Tax=Bacterioplanes sanyensis TaxID=1249553 RepID=A0A222FNB1_9GAMM|nr:Ig-like domain-containing protein [Bacterioplanes sanyensis]ASP40172.1 hypothetical protein CHH28_16470 [Bacterioplanes sanyensis]
MFKGLSCGIFLCAVAVTSIASQYDLRLDSPLRSPTDLVSVSFLAKDCENLTRLEVNSDDVEVSAENTHSIDGGGCVVKGIETHLSSGSIGVQVYRGSESDYYQENYSVETVAPSLALLGSSVSGSEGQQSLRLVFEAHDDTDIAYLDVDVSGVKASDIRNNGGVVNSDAVPPFLSYSSRHFPAPGTNEVNVSAVFDRQLDASTLAGDGILIINAVAVDASGNSQTISEYRYTGDSIEDELQSLSYPVDKLFLTSILDRIQLTPNALFKYRGEVVLLGSDSGLSYSVSDDGIIGVDGQGVLYLKEETPTTGNIVISHTDGLSISVPVEVDLSKTVERFVWAEGPVLSGLNTLHELPVIAVEYDDGSSRVLEKSFPLNLSYPQEAQSFLMGDGKRVGSKVELLDSDPLSITVSSPRIPGVESVLELVVEDAPPKVTVTGGGRIEVGENLSLMAQTQDDVGIDSVSFWRDGSKLLTLERPPFELNLNVSDSMDGQSFQFYALATDSKGQETQSEIVTVRVNADPEGEHPGHFVESPSSQLPVVEQSDYWYRAAYHLGKEGELDGTESSSIRSIKLLLDDEEVGLIRYPMLEVRMIPNDEGKLEKHVYEVWQTQLTAQEVAVSETSLALAAEMQLKNGAVYKDDSRLIRIVENREPEAKLEAPVDNVQVPAGATINVTGYVVDDTLLQGTRVSLLIDGDEVDSRYVRAPDDKDLFDVNKPYTLPQKYKGSFNEHREAFKFEYETSEDDLGDEVDFRVVASDRHGLITKTVTRTVVVIEDQKPSVSVIAPVPSQYITEGETVRFQAKAADDIDVSYVEFYVDGSLLERVEAMPYMVSYSAPESIDHEQVLEFSAKAYDNKGQVGDSQTVKVTLGHDDIPPVIDWVSPQINTLEGEEKVARVPEDSTQVVKLVGSDNVGISKLTVRGLKKTEQGYRLTTDVDHEETLDLTTIPNSLNQYSAILLLDTPKLEASNTLGYASYPVHFEARDRNDNTSKSTVVVRVDKNQGARIEELTVLDSKLYSNETLGVSLIASDDVAVYSIRYRLLAGDQEITALTQYAEQDFVPNSNLAHTLNLDLSHFNIANQAAELRLEVTVYDQHELSHGQFGHQSKTISILEDSDPPKGSIVSPLQGSELLLEDLNTLVVRISDETGIESASLSWEGQTFWSMPDEGKGRLYKKSISTDLKARICQSASGCSVDDVLIELAVRDIHDNRRTSNWRYRIVDDEKPSVSVRLPAQGGRYYEGERVPISLVANDDYQIKEVGYIVYRNGQELFRKALSEVDSAEAGVYYNGSYRVISAKQGPVSVKGYAIDNRGQEAKTDIAIEVIADNTPPSITVIKPDQKNLAARPGSSASIVVNALDDKYVPAIIWEGFTKATNIKAVLTLPDGSQQLLPWAVIGSTSSTEQIKVPNPGTFGEVLYVEQHKRQFKGSFKVSEALVAYEGETLELRFSVADNGDNRVESDVYYLEILKDTEAPVISWEPKPEKVLQFSDLITSITAVDDTAMADLSLEIGNEDDGFTLLANKGKADADEEGTRLKLHSVAIGYEEFFANYVGSSVGLRVKASDTAGNVAYASATLHVTEDARPSVVLNSSKPESLLKNALSMSHVSVLDDSSELVETLVLGSDLTGFNSVRHAQVRFTTNSRDVVLGKDRTLNSQSVSYENVHVALAYDEYSGDSLVFGASDNPTLVFKNGELKLFRDAVQRPIRQLPASLNADTVDVEITSLSQCGAVYSGSVLASELAEVIEEYVGSDTHSIELAIHSSQSPVKKITQYKSRAYAAYPRAIEEFTAYGDYAAQKFDTVFEIEDQNSATGLAALYVGMAADVSEAISGRQFVLKHLVDDIESMNVFALALDRKSHRRSEAPLLDLGALEFIADVASPSLEVSSSVGRILPKERLEFPLSITDSSYNIEDVSLSLNGERLLGHRLAFGDNSSQLMYEHPANLVSGVQQLSFDVLDGSGNPTSHTIDLIAENDKEPTIEWQLFSDSYDELTDKTRLNYAEFWVKHGDVFTTEFSLADDVGLYSYQLFKLARDGSRTPVSDQILYEKGCGELWEKRDQPQVGVRFNEYRSTEYLAVVEDVNGKQDSIKFIVHPKENIQPQVQFVAPKDGQYIVSGAKRLLAVLAFTDDDDLDPEKHLALYIDGQQLRQSKEPVKYNNGSPEVQEAFGRMYDALESKYTQAIAQRYASYQSANAGTYTYVFEMPEGITRVTEDLKLRATVTDVEGVSSSQEITLSVAPDETRPEVKLWRPERSYSPVESTDFTVRFSAYDNVAVSNIVMREGYGVAKPDGSYIEPVYGDVLINIANIPSGDANPSSTENIDTPKYERIVSVPTIADALRAIDETLGDAYDAADSQGMLEQFNESHRLDYWVKFEVTDSNGNTREHVERFAIQVDERPVVDIAEPLPGAFAVEGDQLYVNVHAFDDVGLTYVRLWAYHGEKEETLISEMKLTGGPYNYLVDVPEFDHDTPANNKLTLVVEALDTYGKKYGDLDNHRVFERLSLKIVEDEKPVIAIASPLSDAEPYTEGQHVVVEVNATDDIGIDQVVLNIDGLITGDVVQVDRKYPYEFVFKLPYGQAGTPVKLSATVTELNYAGKTPQQVSTLDETLVNVIKDIDEPVITLISPTMGDSNAIVELQDLPYDAEVDDNVEVAQVRFDILVEGKVVASALNTAPPYFGYFPIRTIADYLDLENPPEELSATFKVTAVDGAGNESDVSTQLLIKKNQPPVISEILALDHRGLKIGSGNIEDGLTHGRQIVISAVAKDDQGGGDGIDEIELYKLDAAGDAQLIDKDYAAPFQYHYSINDVVGKELTFRARAKDTSGLWSDISGELKFVVNPNAPPTVEIIKPFNDQSAIIEGQSLEMVAKVSDDLGADAIERVDFYMNDIFVETSYQNMTQSADLSAAENKYQVYITLPEGADGAVLQAIAYDREGLEGKSAPRFIKQVDDTVQPKPYILAPVDGDIVTIASADQPVKLRVAVEDIGNPVDRHVYMKFVREARLEDGSWKILASDTVELAYNDALLDSGEQHSEPENYYYIYNGSYSNGAIFSHDDSAVQRVRAEAWVETPSDLIPTVVHASNEVGMAFSRRYFIQPASEISSRGFGHQVYYTAVDQFFEHGRHGPLMTAWSTASPYNSETGIGNTYAPQASQTGLYTLGLANLDEQSEGVTYAFSENLNGAAEVFSGSITEILADDGVVYAAKSGEPDAGYSAAPAAGGGDPLGLFGEPEANPTPGIGASAAFVQGDGLSSEISKDSNTGRIDDYANAELLIFNRQNGDNQFGLPYLLKGRIDLPHAQVYGFDVEDELALVANGDGGVIAFNVHDLSMPYRIGFVKPDGYARDVVIDGEYAYIAASHQGVVVVDIRKPSLPVVAEYDTFGIANRLDIEGDYLYVANMAGNGLTADLEVVNISDPQNPEHVYSYAATHGREDYVLDGIYDVEVVGGLAYITVNYSDQEDKPAQSVVEVIDVTQERQYEYFETRNAVTHSSPDFGDIGARGITASYNEVYVASGKQGIGELELNSLTILNHAPFHNEKNVALGLSAIDIRVSHAIKLNQELSEYVSVWEGLSGLGENISDQFRIDLVTVVGEALDTSRHIRLTPKQGVSLEAASSYVVRIEPGLEPLTGGAMSQAYEFRFDTLTDANAVVPDIQALSPNKVSTQGNEELTITGHFFQGVEQVFIADREALILNLELINSDDGLYKLVVKTPANYAGAATVKVVNEWGVEDAIVGTLVYADDLRISNVSPAVVRVDQPGENERVEIIGYGFTPSVQVTAYPVGQPEKAKVNWVDNEHIVLKSGETLLWTIPQFDEPYRGFVTLEIADDKGNKVVLPRALFFGSLVVDTTLRTRSKSEPGLPRKRADADKLLLNPALLPLGKVEQLVSDPELSMIYVLGSPRGKLYDESAFNAESLNEIYSRGWISLLHYDRAKVSETMAPMHGLGYYNTPADLSPAAMHLVGDYLYVVAHGLNFSGFDTTYEGRDWLLVYDAVKALPGSGDGVEQTDGLNRSFIHAIPLPSDMQNSSSPNSRIGYLIDHKDSLLIVGEKGHRVHVLSLQNPARPGLIHTLDSVVIEGGKVDFAVADLYVQGDELFVKQQHRSAWQVFDLTKASIPQVASLGKYSALASTALVDQHIVGDFETFQRRTSADWTQLGQLELYGAQLYSRAWSHASAHSTAAVKLNAKGCRQNSQRTYLSLVDYSDKGNMRILDSLLLPDGKLAEQEDENGELEVVLNGLGNSTCSSYAPTDLLYTDDGLLISVSVNSDNSLIQVVDSHLQELVTTWPEHGAERVALDTEIRLLWTLPIDNVDDVAQYVSLLKDVGEDQAQAVTFELRIATDNARTLILTPQQPLEANSQYRIELSSDVRSRRTTGLTDVNIQFSTAAYSGENLTWLGMQKGSVSTQGETLYFDLKGANNPEFYFAGKLSEVTRTELLDNGATRYYVTVPPGQIGAVLVEIIDQDGRWYRNVGGLVYVEPLHLKSISPAQGSLEGGQKVVIESDGLPADVSQIQVFFGNFLADVDDYQLLDADRLEVTTPANPIGVVDVRIQLTDNQHDVLEQAYRYLQPIQSEIKVSSPTAMAIDPSHTYMMVASGSELRIVNIDPSKWTGDNKDDDDNNDQTNWDDQTDGDTNLRNPLNPDDLRRLIDLDGDGIDDRIVFNWRVDSSYTILGVQGYFERGRDLVYLTLAQPAGGDSDRNYINSKLVVLAIDDDFGNAQVVRELPLPGNLARGILVENNQLLVAMGDAGLGLVDAYIPAKAYLMDWAELAARWPVLGVDRTSSDYQGQPVYATVSGHWRHGTVGLDNSEIAGDGGFHMVSRDASGMTEIASLDIPASDVIVRNEIAYLAAGDRGIVAVDIANPLAPKVLTRLSDIGKVHDIAISGHILYAALGERGILAIDITQPTQLQAVSGLDVFNGLVSHLVTALPYSVVSGGKNSNTGAIQVIKDSELKLFRVDPANRILDYDADGLLKAIFRFSKDIDLHPQNAQYFRVLDEQGNAIAADVVINGNQAEVSLKDPAQFNVGDRLVYHIDAGVTAAKPITETSLIRLYELKNSQQVELVYRGRSANRLWIDSVLPRRQLVGEPLDITASVHGIPLDKVRVKAWMGPHEIAIDRIESNDDQERVGILYGHLPAVSVAGYYDVVVEIERYGVWERVSLLGAIAIDNPIELADVTPQWGPLRGGTRIEVTGKGFEPGNSVVEGLSMLIGSAPVTDIDVISSKKLIAYTPRGNVGPRRVMVQNRYGQSDTLASGFGYGLRSLSFTKAAYTVPTDVIVDQHTGVAASTAGFFITNFGPYDLDTWMRQSSVVGGESSPMHCAR